MKIKLKGAKNTRDFSEYDLPGFIRSGHLHNLTPQDTALLADTYHVRTVIDLRTSKEVEEKPDAVIPNAAYLHIPLFDEVVPGISHEQQADENAAAERIPDLTALYRGLVTDAASVGQIKRVMEVIQNPSREGAVLWHCTEGKDRCGIISALFLLSHGWDEDTVMRDYLMTNDAARRWRVRGYYLLMLLQKRDRAFARQVRNVFLAKPDYLNAAMEDLKALALDAAPKP